MSPYVHFNIYNMNNSLYKYADCYLLFSFILLFLLEVIKMRSVCKSSFCRPTLDWWSDRFITACNYLTLSYYTHTRVKQNQDCILKTFWRWSCGWDCNSVICLPYAQGKAWPFQGISLWNSRVYNIFSWSYFFFLRVWIYIIYVSLPSNTRCMASQRVM